jgi:hypothetical protein
MAADLAGRVRAICLALPEAAERLSHGMPIDNATAGQG